MLTFNKLECKNILYILVHRRHTAIHIAQKKYRDIYVVHLYLACIHAELRRSTHATTCLFMQDIAEMFVTVGMCEEAVAAYIKVCIVHRAISCCLLDFCH